MKCQPWPSKIKKQNKVVLQKKDFLVLCLNICWDISVTSWKVISCKSSYCDAIHEVPASSMTSCMQPEICQRKPNLFQVLSSRFSCLKFSPLYHLPVDHSSHPIAVPAAVRCYFFSIRIPNGFVNMPCMVIYSHRSSDKNRDELQSHKFWAKKLMTAVTHLQRIALL